MKKNISYDALIKYFATYKIFETKRDFFVSMDLFFKRNYQSTGLIAFSAPKADDSDYTRILLNRTLLQDLEMTSVPAYILRKSEEEGSWGSFDFNNKNYYYLKFGQEGDHLSYGFFHTNFELLLILPL